MSRLINARGPFRNLYESSKDDVILEELIQYKFVDGEVKRTVATRHYIGEEDYNDGIEYTPLTKPKDQAEVRKNYRKNHTDTKWHR